MNRLVTALILLLMSTSAIAATAPLPRTGQTGCWDSGGASIACTGTGQDGDTKAGVAWPASRFTDNKDGTVTDNLTGLIWLKNARCFSSQSWQDGINSANALASGACGLTDGSKAGEWRLPNINELESLVNLQEGTPANWLISSGFWGVASSWHWSSNTDAAGSSYARPVYLNFGTVGNGIPKTNITLYVWPVKGGGTGTVEVAATGQSKSYAAGDDGALQKGARWPDPRFSDNGDQTMVDHLTGLVWSKDPNAAGPAACVSGSRKPWQETLDYINCLNRNSYLGYNDWRLPNRKELLSLVNRGEPSPAGWLTSQGFTNVQPYEYRSSSTYLLTPANAWYVNMYDGYLNANSKIYYQYFWPVRGGESGAATPVNGVCGSANGATFATAPGSGLCLAGTASTVTGNAAWNWSCSGGNGGSTANCTAAIRSYSVTFASGGNGTLSGTASQAVRHGANATAVTANASPGYHFVGWSGTGGFVSSTSNPLTVTAVTADMAISASFAADVSDGSCGASHGLWFSSAPTVSLCVAGTAGSVSGSGPWSWSCSGGNGGSTAQCWGNVAPAPGTPLLLPRSGQVNCYGTTNNVIACSGTGQDGEMQAGVAWPAPRFVDNRDQTITDKLTGLVWSRDANPMKTRDPSFDNDYYLDPGSQSVGDGKVTWQHALEYVKKLNKENYLGFSDWRMPDRDELRSLENLQQASQVTWLNSWGFSNVMSSEIKANYYWTSTTNTRSTAFAFCLSMDALAITPIIKNANYFLWPVRSGELSSVALPKTGQTACYDATGKVISCTGTGQDGELQAGRGWPAPRFVDNGDGTISDQLTGLAWTTDAHAPGPAACTPAVSKTWQSALNYIKCLNQNSYLGKHDWRLPNKKELESMALNAAEFDNATWLASLGFSNVGYDPFGGYWSSTVNLYYPYSRAAWVVGITQGSGGIADMTTSRFVWPVRSSPIAAAPINGACGTSNGHSFAVAPSTGLCSAGTASSVTGTGPWSWTCQGANGGSNATCSSGVVRILAVTLAGGGSGSVNSNPAGIACDSSSGPGCSATFASGTGVTLGATPSVNAFFGGWSACTGTGPCQVTMDASRDVTATFSANPALLRIDGSSAAYYSLDAVLRAISTGGKTVLAKATSLVENVIMTSPADVLFKGGFTDASFKVRSTASSTVISGSMKIRLGTLRVERLAVR
ncbi:MAG: hypothetical protein A2075_22915 [Geobacteraceae bacterium GWC2_58_44]|nr:MAG: hypothetical protein A2075_22915 [Geobacteraceae bacterium GWC2_58_44]HBG07820.1 hypothetical protein [Geobacter sp.]